MIQVKELRIVRVADEPLPFPLPHTGHCSRFRVGRMSLRQESREGMRIERMGCHWVSNYSWERFGGQFYRQVQAQAKALWGHVS
jgi:hypothetical protein